MIVRKQSGSTSKKTMKQDKTFVLNKDPILRIIEDCIFEYLSSKLSMSKFDQRKIAFHLSFLV